MTNILVTGASGQLGLTIQDSYEKYKNLNFIFLNSSELDITNFEQVPRIFKENNFDYCIYCAAYTNVEEAEKNSSLAYNVNAEGVRNLANNCKKFQIILVHISTDYVFDGKKNAPYGVNDSTNPINEYGKSKLKGEKYIDSILDDYFIVRTSWLYSKIHGHNFYKTILKKIKAGETVRVTDKQIGSPTNTENLVSYILGLITNDCLPGLYHFSDNEHMTWYDFAKFIIDSENLNSSELLVLDKNYHTFAKRPRYSILKMN